MDVKEMRKYESIVRASRVIGHFNTTDDIDVTEKIDGANASFLFDKSGLRFFSRNQEILGDTTFHGFVPFIKDKVANANFSDMAFMSKEQYIFYGEWNTKHKINYKKEYQNTFTLFDMYIIGAQEYASRACVELWANRLGLQMPQCFYRGKYQSVEHLLGFVGKSKISDPDDTGEGIVVRNLTTGITCKLVREGFSEVKQKKSVKEVNLDFVNLYEQLCTPARVEKMLYKGRDEGVYNDFEVESYKHIMKYIGNEIPKDIIKEEGDLIPDNIKIEEFIVFIQKRVPILVKEVINEILA